MLRRCHRPQCNQSGGAPKADSTDSYICLNRCA
jgi:hypothetical protein